MFLLCPHCKKHYTASQSFFIEPSNFKFKKIHFLKCPRCQEKIYKEITVSFKDEIAYRIHFGKKAEKLFNRALFNRLVFLEKISQGTKSNQNWYYGDFEKTNKKDEKGNPIYLQLKKNFNGQITVLGAAPIKYGYI